MSEKQPAAVKEKQDETQTHEAVSEPTLEDTKDEGSAPDAENETLEGGQDETITEPAGEETVEDELTEEEYRRLSAKTQKRIRSLVEENKALKASRGEGYGLEQVRPVNTDTLPWDETRTEYTIDEIRAMSKAEVEGLRRELYLKEDARTLEQKYTELNPASENYDDELVQTIAETFKSAQAGSPTLRLADFTERMMRLRRSGETKGKAQVTAKVVRQVAEQAITPQTNNTPKEDFGSLTLEEMRSRIGVVE